MKRVIEEEEEEEEESGRMNWLELLILYTTTKRENNEWYSKEDLIDAANIYYYNGKWHSGPYSNTTGYGPSDGRFKAHDNIANKREIAVTKAIQKLKKQGSLMNKPLYNESGIGKEHYARNMVNTDEKIFSSLDKPGNFGVSTPGDVTENTARTKKLKKENDRDCTIWGMCENKVKEWLSEQTVDGVRYGAMGGKRKSKKSKKSKTKKTKSKKSKSKKTKTKKNRSR